MDNIDLTLNDDFKKEKIRSSHIPRKYVVINKHVDMPDSIDGEYMEDLYQRLNDPYYEGKYCDCCGKEILFPWEKVFCLCVDCDNRLKNNIERSTKK